MSIKERIESLVKPEIQALSAYKTVPPGRCIKLDAMENPYTWPEPMVDEWLSVMRSAEVNRYPDPAAAELKEALYEYQGIPENKALLLGNGSDELIQIILMAIAKPDAVVLAPEPTFVMYKQIALSLGLQFKGVPLSEGGFALNLELICEAIRKEQPAVVFLAYPNNPTGNLFSQEEIKEILRVAPGLVVVDEAYAPFTDASFLDCSEFDEKLLVMRTVSKLGLAGLRLGYLVGDACWIEQLEKIRLPYNINTLSQLSAVFALKNHALFEAQTTEIRKSRAFLFKQLEEIEGVEPIESEANFILFRLAKGLPAPSIVHSSLKEAGILIKNLHGAMPLLDRCLRVTVGKPEENGLFISALTDIVR